MKYIAENEPNNCSILVDQLYYNSRQEQMKDGRRHHKSKPKLEPELHKYIFMQTIFRVLPL